MKQTDTDTDTSTELKFPSTSEHSNMKTEEDDKLYETAPDFRTETEDWLVLLLQDTFNEVPGNNAPFVQETSSFGGEAFASNYSLSNQASGNWAGAECDSFSMFSTSDDSTNAQALLLPDVKQDSAEINDTMLVTLANVEDLGTLQPVHEITLKTEPDTNVHAELGSCNEQKVEVCGRCKCNCNQTETSVAKSVKRSNSSDPHPTKRVAKVTAKIIPAPCKQRIPSYAYDEVSEASEQTPASGSTRLLSPIKCQQSYRNIFPLIHKPPLEFPELQTSERSTAFLTPALQWDDQVSFPFDPIEMCNFPEKSTHQGAPRISPITRQIENGLHIETSNFAIRIAKHSTDEEAGESLKKNRTCEKEGCPTTRHFGYVGENARFCFYHKEDGMINLSLRKCLECSRTASFGLSETRLKQYCKEHKKPEHINLSLKKCTIELCEKTANYGFHNKPLQFCSAHKGQGMELRRTWKKMENEGRMHSFSSDGDVRNNEAV